MKYTMLFASFMLAQVSIASETPGRARVVAILEGTPLQQDPIVFRSGGSGYVLPPKSVNATPVVVAQVPLQPIINQPSSPKKRPTGYSQRAKDVHAIVPESPVIASESREERDKRLSEKKEIRQRAELAAMYKEVCQGALGYTQAQRNIITMITQKPADLFGAQIDSEGESDVEVAK